MKERFFTLTLLSDIVLQSHSNTQGKNESRDFISGSVILGIVAGHYDEFSDPFAIFHSGAVRFGEAKPFINGKIGYKTPLCFFAPKDLPTDSAKNAKQDAQKQIYNALFYDLTNAKEQLRQIRSGYINEDFKYAHLSYRYTQKVNLQGKSAQNQSLQNAQSKSTKENEMFGYEAICKGAVFGFVVSFDEHISNEDIEKITQILCQTHFIGKSKNAEYGEVLIESTADFHPAKRDLNLNAQDFSTQEITLYVASQLALFEKSMPTFSPNAKNLGLESAQIMWEKTHLKTKIHTPYNQKRKSKDSARLIIEQGSVITLTNLSQSDKERLQHGKILCGGFLSEGYGEMLINPSFLACGAKAHLIPSHIDSANLQNPQNTPDSNLIAYIYDLYDLQRRKITSANAVDDFIATHKDRFSKVTNAQWGAIRAFTQMADDKALKDRILCYINEERLKEKWEEGREILQDFIEANDRESIALLATRMPKVDLAQNLAQDFGKSASGGGK